MTDGKSEAPIRLPLPLRLLRRIAIPHKLGVLERIFGRKLARHGVAWVRCWNGVTWKLDLDDACHRWIVYGEYEGTNGVAYARKTLANGGVFIDSGANIGQWLLYIAGMPQVQCLAIEPLASARQWLEGCISRQAGWDRTCEVLDIGLGESETCVELQIDGPRSTTRQDWYVGRDLERQMIRLVPLEKLLQDRGMDRVSFWKLDMEGGEYSALIGAGRYLSLERISNIYFESNSTDFPPIRELLRHHGYQVYRLHHDGTKRVADVSVRSTDCFLATAA